MAEKKYALITLIIMIALAIVATADAQGEVTATVLGPESASDSGSFTVGDPLEITLVVTHPAGYQVIAPELTEGQQWGDFVIRSQSPATKASNDDGSETTIIVYDARLFVPGEFSTPPLPVKVTDGTGQLLEVTAAPAPVTITSVLVEGDTQLRDIKPQADLPFTNLLPWLAVGLLLAAIAGGGYWLWQRRQARLALAALDKRLPHEKALDQLAHIAALGLPEQERFKEHYSLVSDTVRLYLEQAYDVPMMERTTGEVAGELQQTAMDRGVRRRVITFLEESDLVKFADVTPSEQEAYELLAQGRMIVEATMPPAISPGSVDDVDGGPGNLTVAAHAFSNNGQNEQVEVSA